MFWLHSMKNHEKYIFYKNCILRTVSLNFPLPLLMVTRVCHLVSVCLACVLEKYTVIFFWSITKSIKDSNISNILLVVLYVHKKLWAYVKFLVICVAVEITQHQSVLEIELKLAILFFCAVIKYLIFPFVLQGINLRKMASPLNGLTSTKCPK